MTGGDQELRSFFKRVGLDPETIEILIVSRRRKPRNKWPLGANPQEGPNSIPSHGRIAENLDVKLFDREVSFNAVVDDQLDEQSAVCERQSPKG
jgi:hypothetical protein